MASSYEDTVVHFGFLDYVAIILFILFLVGGGILFWQYNQAQATSAKITNELKNLEADIKKLKDQNLEKIARADAFITQLKEDEVSWSKVIDQIIAITPENVDYSAYIGTESKEISLNVEANSVEKVIDTIHAYTENNTFPEVFVPSVNKGITPEGTLFSFTINTSYAPSNK